VCDLKLFPGDYSCGSDFVGFDSKPAILIIEHVCFLGENSWEESHDSPAEKATVGSCITAIEEGILLLRVTMEIAVDPYLAFVFLLDLLHQIFNTHNLRMELWLWVDPLTVEINTGHRVSIVTNHHPIWIHTGYQYECIKPSEILGFSAIRSNKFINAAKHLTPR